MPTRSAIVAFSADEVYAIAELVRRERGGAAVVTGSLSPRTRNAQVALYQSGDVDFLIATDAIGMGLNLDVDHVAFAQDSKFDGYQYRKLTAAELAQIAGRAGRYTRDGTFGITSRVTPFDNELVEALETHTFAPHKVLSWRNRELSFASIAELQASLEMPADNPRLMRAPSGTDFVALESLSRDREVHEFAMDEEGVRLLWEIAKVPDYRKISPASHAEILTELFTSLRKDGAVREDWFANLVNSADNTHGEIDALSARIASIRTCTYISNRDNWLEKPEEWREKTREVEDRLSDALHETLTKRFIDRRTSILMKRLKENRMLEAEIAQDGKVSVEGHDIGTLRGFRFTPEGSSGKDAKALNSAAAKALASEIEKRAERLAAAPNSDFALSSDGSVRWLGDVVSRLTKGESPLAPKVLVLADEQLNGTPLEKVVARIERWIANHVNTLLKPFSDLENNQELNGIAKGIAFQLIEGLGSLDRKPIADDLKNLDQDARASLRRNGVRFGAYHVFIPALLKPAPAELICLLWAVANDQIESAGLTEVPNLSAAGRTSAPLEETFLRDFYRLAGFRILGRKAVRIDILERLADLIRPTTLWKPDQSGQKPDGAIDGRTFYVTPAMMSILGATHEDMEVILKELGYRCEERLEAEIKPAPEQNSLNENNEGAEEPRQEPVVTEKQTETVENPEPAIQASEKAEAEPEEEKKIFIWRYGGKNAGGKPSRPNNKGRKYSGKRNQKSGGKPKVQNQVQTKKIDPDSPFAALAALK
ncbi:MAG: helicase-related protein, partial [Pseudomonadota bacterium]